jgi:hypothetical protein
MEEANARNWPKYYEVQLMKTLKTVTTCKIQEIPWKEDGVTEKLRKRMSHVLGNPS